MKRYDEDTVIPWSDELPPRLPPGVYEAVVLRAKHVSRFGLLWAEFQFRIVTPGEYFDSLLCGYCNLGQAAHPSVRSRSKFASWQRAIAAYAGGRASRVSLRSFRNYWYRVRVETTTHNHQKQKLPERDQYSSVADIVEVVGQVGELSNNTKGRTR